MKKILMIMFFVFLGIAMNAQELPSIIPPSKNAQAFIKYGDYPVSKYTGVPDISIPLYTIQLKDISIPISLSYNASGIKVEEEASCVGLGWVLNAGGLISRSVIGHDDFDSDHDMYFTKNASTKMYDLKNIYRLSTPIIKGYKTGLPFTLPEKVSELDFYSMLGYNGNEDSYDCGNIDFDPDVYNYNFLGYSGKFIFLRTGEIQKEKEDNLQIASYTTYPNGRLTLNSFTTTDPSGTKYYFEQKEQTIPNIKYLNYKVYYSSYHLTKIETVSGTIIKFNYKTKGTVAESFSRSYDINTLDTRINCSASDVVYLDNIDFPGGAVIFNYTFDREDRKVQPKLSSVYIQELGVNKFRWDFTQSYFIANQNGNDLPTLTNFLTKISSNYYYQFDDAWNKKRLKLTEVKCVGDQALVYKFDYNETQIPTKLSSSIDHWGYYNGALNYSLIPNQYQNIAEDASIKILSLGLGANRESSELYNQAFMLKSIVYPTGGKTAFVFEGNKYKTDCFENDPYKRDFMHNKVVTKLTEGIGVNNAPYHWKHTEKLTITKRTEVWISSEVTLNPEVYNGRSIGSVEGQALVMNFDIEKNGAKIWSRPYYAPVKVTEQNKTWKQTYSFTLDPGVYDVITYGILRKFMSNIDFSVTSFADPEEYLKGTPVGLGGGLRIKEIQSFDSKGKQAEGKKYSYTLNGSFNELQTSGKLMFYPRYRQCVKKSIVQSTSNGLRGSGYSVGYSTVSVFDTGSPENGKIVYEFTNMPDVNLSYTWKNDKNHPKEVTWVKDENPEGIGAYKHSENGTLQKETIFEYKNGVYNKLKHTVYQYGGLGGGPHIIWAICKSNYVQNSTAPGCLNELSEYGLAIFMQDGPSYYPMGYLYPALRPMQMILQKKTETYYNGAQPLEVVTDYDHDLKSFLVTKETVKGSNNIVRSVQYKYPFDYTDPIMKDLVSQNRINSPVETTVTAGSEIQKSNRSYSRFSGKVMQSAYNTNTGANKIMESRLKYLAYDGYGNPTHIWKDGETFVYLWGYKGQRLIAEIRNVSYSEVTTALEVPLESLSQASTPDMVKVNRLRTLLKKAFVTTYTYAPLVGMTSITDPIGIVEYYEYDSFGRLKYTKDGDSNVLKYHDYQYKK